MVSFPIILPILRREISSDTLLHEWLTVLFGNGLRMVIGLASSVLIARTLGPENFGLYAVLAGLIAITATFSDAGLTNAAVKFIAPALISRSNQAQQFTGAYLYAKLALATLCAVVGILLSPILSSWILGNKELAALIILSFVGVFTTAMSNSISTLLQAARRFRIYATLQLLNPFLTLIAAAVLYFWGALTVQALLWFIILFPLISAYVGYTKVKPFFRTQDSKSLFVLNSSLKAIQRLFSFSKWIFIAATGSVFFSQLDLILARNWVGAEAAGHYALALSISMKAAVLNGSLATALLPRASTVGSTSNPNYYMRSALSKTLSASLLILVTLPFIDSIIQIFYGEAFRPAAKLTVILLLMVVINLNVLPLNLLVYPLNRPEWLALGELGKVVLFILGARLSVNAWGSVGLAVSKLAAEILIGLIYLLLIPRVALQFNRGNKKCD